MSGSIYPGGIDSFTNPTAANSMSDVTVPHDKQHANANDAIAAIEATLGTNPQGSFASVGAALASLPSTYLAQANTNAAIDAHLGGDATGLVTNLPKEYVGKALPPSGGDDTAYLQNLMNSQPSVVLSDGDYSVTGLTWPASLTSFVGTLKTRLIHANGATGPILAQQDTSQRVMKFLMRDIQVRGNTGAGETHGIDWSGFSYGNVINVAASNCTMDGHYMAGAITPTNRQTSNIRFVGCSGDLNGRHGFNADTAAGEANTACTFYGLETTGNGGDGIHISQGESLTFYGSCTQGNIGYDLYSNGTSCDFPGTYLEHTTPGVSIYFDTGSSGNNLGIKHLSYPIATSLIDLGSGNTITHPMQDDGRDLFPNRDLRRQQSSYLPRGLAMVGTYTPVINGDPAAPNVFNVTIPITTNFTGFNIMLTGTTYSAVAGRWVTVVLSAQNNSPTAANLRVYAVDQSGTLNSANGEFIVRNTNATTGYERLHYSVRFPVTCTGNTPPVVRFYLVYDNVSGTVTWNISELRVLNGVVYTGTNPSVSAVERVPELPTAPTGGTWTQGDEVRNCAPAVGSPKGWACTVSGTPGTWVSEGNL